MRIFKHPLWSRFVAIAWPFFVSEARAKAIGTLALMVVLLLAVNGLNFVNSYIMRDFMTDLAQRKGTFFYYFGTALVAVFALASIGEALSYFLEQRLGLVWREWLTHRLIDRYLASHAYHRQTVNESIDNPDQRISEDTKTFTTSSLSFLVLIANGLLALAAFLGVLWSITPWLVLTAVLYAAAGTLGTILLGRNLVPLNNRQLQKEADFRFALVRVRESAAADNRRESVGESKGRLLDRFNAVVENFRAIIRVTRNVGIFTKEYNYLIQIIPALVVAPLYFQGKVQFGTIPQAAMAFGQVLGAFSLIVTQFQVMSTYAAVVNRLGSMWEATQSPDLPSAEQKESVAAEIETSTDNERIAYDQLTLWTPQEKRVLLRDLTLELTPGQRLLITGPSGSGKTALCLASAGLWGTGRGKVVRPGMGHITFLPQRLYTATGRLRDLLLCGWDHHPCDDDKLRTVLRTVGLDYLAENAEGLDSEWDWPNDLSVGDQHALALARLLLAQPRFAVLDGVPWGLSPPRLRRLYEALAQSPITYLSAGGSRDLLSYHDWWLELHGDGAWQLRSASPPAEVGNLSSA